MFSKNYSTVETYIFNFYDATIKIYFMKYKSIPLIFPTPRYLHQMFPLLIHASLPA